MRKCRLMFIAAFAAMLAGPVLANGYGTQRPAYAPTEEVLPNGDRCREKSPGQWICDSALAVAPAPAYAHPRTYREPVAYSPVTTYRGSPAYATAQPVIVEFQSGWIIRGRHRQYADLCVCEDQWRRQHIVRCPRGYGGGYNSGGHQAGMAPIVGTLVGVGTALARQAASPPRLPCPAGTVGPYQPNCQRLAQPQVRYLQPSGYRPQPIPRGGPQGGVMVGGGFRQTGPVGGVMRGGYFR